MLIGQVCRYVNNWFTKEIISGTFKIENHSLVQATATGQSFDIVNGQYFRIIGSTMNDGVYQYPAVLIDETFRGSIYLMAVPKDFLDLVQDIEKWNQKYGETGESPFASESFDGYSYTKASNSESVGWKGAFKSQLNTWRKI